ncbi:MAG TPA: penicillin-binding transpeptidase domain-containing protein [Pyrinomonadaceae bacterium]|nr:penicillin-binding transpeptidase domain-containing protein [Pyrinomonadaceae bacterium]
MKLMCPENRLTGLAIVMLLSLICFSAGAAAQTKKAAPATKSAPKAVAKKDDPKAKTTKNSPRTSTTAKAASPTKKDTRTPANSKQTATRTAAKTDPKNSKNPQKGQTTAKTAANSKTPAKPAPKNTAAARRAEAERKKVEEARRQAALAEQRRREQAAREARERRLAFERGLRNETVANIANDVVDGEDMKLREAAVNALGNRAGTVVVMEAKTGKLLTVVNQDWAIKHGFKPCSTIKLVTGVAGINEEVINESGGIGESTAGLKLDNALARSNNPYFQQVGSRVGNAKMIDYARKLGLGTRTGVNAEGETSGKLPYGNNNGRIYSHGDDFEVSPLQLAVMVSALSNGGKKVVPQFYRPRVEKTAFREKAAGRVELPRQSYEGVLPGMVGAAEYGTAARGVDASMGVAGKTGSCIGGGSWVGLFASVAPVEDPKYAVVVITRGQDERGRHAAAVAGQVYRELRSRITRDPASMWAKKKAGTELTESSVAAADPDEEADEAGQPLETPNVKVVRSAPATQPAVKGTVQKTTQSKPVFPPVVITYDKKPAEQNRPRIVKN